MLPEQTFGYGLIKIGQATQTEFWMIKINNAPELRVSAIQH